MLVDAIKHTENMIDTSESAQPAEPSLEEILKNIPTNVYQYTEEDIKKIKSKFKTYEQLKSDMKEIDMDIKTDNEIMNGLFNEYLVEDSYVSDEKKILIMQEFEELVHQIDNALTFLSAGGYERIILPNLVNQTNVALRKSALLILGAALQNNAKAKIFAFEKNAGEHLTKIIANSNSADEIGPAIYALGGFLRGFPLAQREILPKSGLSILLNILKDDRSHLYRIKIKIFRLLDDIYQNLKDSSSEDEMYSKQFSLTDYEQALNSSIYCDSVLEFLKLFKSDIDVDVDVAKDVLNHLENMQHICLTTWSQSETFQTFLFNAKNITHEIIYDFSNDD